MVMRCTRWSRYSAVISSADSRRSPRSIFAIIARSSLMRGLLASSLPLLELPLLDHAHGFALGARERARRHERHLGGEPDGPGQALADAPAQVDEDRVRGVEAPAALDHRRRGLHLHLEPRQCGAAV